MSLQALLLGTLAVLVIATIAGLLLRRTVRSDAARATVANINLRIAAWWVLVGAMAVALVIGDAAVVAFFAVFSCLALGEFCALLPARDRGLLWISLAFTLAQYALVWSRSAWFGVAMPLAAFLYVPAHLAIAGETDRFLERAAKIYWGWMLASYCLSYAPALHDRTLLFYLLVVVESSDVLQYLWGKLAGRAAVAPRVSPHKTWAGFVGGIATATALGTALYRATPFSPAQAAAICAAVTLAGFVGGLVMSAIKRDSGIKDYGTLIAGHGGVLDRIDSLCFAAPLFYYLVRCLAGPRP